MDVARLTAELLGLGDLRPEVRQTSSPAAFFVDLPDRTIAAKRPAPGRPGSALVEAYAYRAAADRGVRVPAVLAVSEDPELVLLEVLPGVTLWSRDRPVEADAEIWRRAGADLRALHEIRVPGFGPLLVQDGKIRGESGVWSPFVSYAREQGLVTLADAGFLTASEVARLQERYAAAEPLMACTDGRLLHGDLEGGHVFADSSGAYHGILDFGQAQAGDPHWDLARVPLWDGAAALDALLDGYGRDTLTGDDREVLLPLYLLAFVVRHAVRVAALGGNDDNIREHLTQSGYQRLL